MRFSGKRAIVTGGAKGIGAAITRALVAEGARVAIADIDERAAMELAEGMADAIRVVKLDVTDEGDWNDIVADLRDHWGGVDILVNNAGIASAFTTIEDRRPEDWDAMMAISLRGPFLGTRALLPVFRSQGSGAIVNLSSVGGIGQSQIIDLAYACSKAGLRVLTRVTAAQHASEGVRCNSVHPGPIDTEMVRLAYGSGGALEKRLERIPMGRLIELREVVSAILYLASDDATCISGVALAVDGAALVQ